MAHMGKVVASLVNMLSTMSEKCFSAVFKKNGSYCSMGNLAGIFKNLFV